MAKLILNDQEFPINIIVEEYGMPRFEFLCEEFPAIECKTIYQLRESSICRICLTNDSMAVYISVFDGKERQNFPAELITSIPETQKFFPVVPPPQIVIDQRNLMKIIEILNNDPYRSHIYNFSVEEYFNESEYFNEPELDRALNQFRLSCNPLRIYNDRVSNFVETWDTRDGFIYLPLGKFSSMIAIPSINNGKVTDLEGNVIVSLEWYKEDLERKARWAEDVAKKEAKKGKK